MSGRTPPAQQLDEAVHGRPGQMPQSCATGISSAAKQQLDAYGNSEVKSRILALVDRKRKA
jgi:hypothetical protein